MDELRFKMVLVIKRESQSDNATTPAKNVAESTDK